MFTRAFNEAVTSVYAVESGDLLIGRLEYTRIPHSDDNDYNRIKSQTVKASHHLIKSLIRALHDRHTESPRFESSHEQLESLKLYAAGSAREHDP